MVQRSLVSSRLVWPGLPKTPAPATRQTYPAIRQPPTGSGSHRSRGVQDRRRVVTTLAARRFAAGSAATRTTTTAPAATSTADHENRQERAPRTQTTQDHGDSPLFLEMRDQAVKKYARPRPRSNGGLSQASPFCRPPGKVCRRCTRKGHVLRRRRCRVDFPCF